MQMLVRRNPQEGNNEDADKNDADHYNYEIDSQSNGLNS